MTSSVIANHLHIDVSASERDYGAPTFRGLRQKHLIDRETAGCKSEGGCRHVQAPCPVDLCSGGGHGRYLLALEIPYPMPPVSYTHLRAHETGRNLVCRLLLEKK